MRIVFYTFVVSPTSPKIKLWIFLALLFCAPSLFAQSLPSFDAQTLTDQKLTFPDAAKNHFTVFIIGFSHKSQDQTKPWGARITDALAAYPDAYSFQVAELEDVPRFVRGMVTSGIRKGIPEPQHSRFLLLFKAEREWKAFVDFSAADDAYVVLVDKSGQLLWRTQGPVSDQKLGVLLGKLKTEIGKPH